MPPGRDSPTEALWKIVLLTGLSASLMVRGSQLEARLPSRHAIGITLRFKRSHEPDEFTVATWMQGCGYEMAPGSISIRVEEDRVEWHFVAVAIGRPRGWTLTAKPEVEQLGLSHSRNRSRRPAPRMQG